MTDRNYLEEELETLIQTDPDAWRFIRESSLDGVWYWDLEEPENEYMSPEFWRLFGFDPAKKKHLASEWQDLINTDDLELAKQNLARHLEDPRHPYDQIVRYRRADGETAWVRCRGMAIRDTEGKAIRLLGAHNDMTELKKKEMAASAVSSLLTQIMNTAQSAIIGFDGAGQIASINAAGRHFLGGYSGPVPFPWPKEITFLDSATLEPLDVSKNPIRQSLAGAALSGETLLMSRKPDNERRYVRVSSAPVGADDRMLSSVVILDDVTEQERQRQHAERSDRLDALGQLTGGIAHDFNNLLATVQYALQLAMDDPGDQRRDAYLQTAMQSVERGVDLTGRLLAFAKQQPGKAKSQDVADLIEEFQKLSIPLIESNIMVDFAMSEDDLLVFCDPAQLVSALLNLVLNARDAILRSGVGGRITVKVRSISEIDTDATLQSERADSYVAGGNRQREKEDKRDASGASYRFIEFSVSDDGPGMTDDVKSRAIDPFFTSKSTNSGTGLGLSMVYGFAQQANGELRIYSEPEQGTTVRLLLPRGDAAGGRENPVERPMEVKGDGQSILVVEDEIGLLMMMDDLISSLGYQVSTARSAQDALELVEAEDGFDLMITDIVMPGGMNGFELAQKMQAAQPGMPILFMSGYTGYSKTEMSEIDAPMLQKPCPPAELARAIALELAKKKS